MWTFEYNDGTGNAMFSTGDIGPDDLYRADCFLLPDGRILLPAWTETIPPRIASLGEGSLDSFPANKPLMLIRVVLIEADLLSIAGTHALAPLGAVLNCVMDRRMS